MKTEKRTELLGLISGAMTTFSFLPQVIAVWRLAPSPAPQVSMTMYGVIMVGVAGWIIYGFRIRSRPVVGWNILTLLFSLAIFSYKLIYG